MKFGPEMSRDMAVEYMYAQLEDAPGPRQLRPSTIAKLKDELQRLSYSPDPKVIRFVTEMYRRYPEMRR